MTTPTTSDLRAAAIEMLEIDRRIAKLVLMEAQLRALPSGDGTLAAIQCRRAVAGLKWRWGECAAILRGGVTMTTKEIRKLVKQLEAESRAAFHASP